MRSDRRIGIKLVSGFVVLAVMCGVVGFVGVNALGLLAEADVSKYHADHVKEDVFEAVVAQRDFVHLRDPKYLDEFFQNVEEAREVLDITLRERIDAEMIGGLNRIIRDLDVYRELMGTLVAKLEQAELDACVELGARITAMIADMQDKGLTLIGEHRVDRAHYGGIDLLVSNIRQIADTVRQGARTMIIAITIAAIIVGLVLGLIVVTQIMRRSVIIDL